MGKPGQAVGEEWSDEKAAQQKCPDGSPFKMSDHKGRSHPDTAECDQLRYSNVTGKSGRDKTAQHHGHPESRRRPDGSGLSEARSEEHTSELQSRGHLVCRLLLEKKKPADRPTARQQR